MDEKYISVTKFKETLAKLTVEGGTEATRTTIARTLGGVVPKLLDDEPSADVQPVVDTENMAIVSDEFICQKCGIYLIDYSKVVMDEDNEELHYEYVPKFCPECGAKIKDGDVE